MIKNRIEPIPKKGFCDKCQKEYHWMDTIRTQKHGRLCMGCYVGLNESKMTRGNLKRQFDQPGLEPIRISIMSYTQQVKLEQGENTIFIRIPFMKEFALEMDEVKRWSTSQ